MGRLPFFGERRALSACVRRQVEPTEGTENERVKRSRRDCMRGFALFRSLRFGCVRACACCSDDFAGSESRRVKPKGSINFIRPFWARMMLKSKIVHATESTFFCFSKEKKKNFDREFIDNNSLNASYDSCYSLDKIRSPITVQRFFPTVRQRFFDASGIFGPRFYRR